MKTGLWLPTALLALLVISVACTPAEQQADTKVARGGIIGFAQYCELDVDNQPATPGWEAWLCKADEAAAAILGSSTVHAVMPAGTLARLRAADGG